VIDNAYIVSIGQKRTKVNAIGSDDDGITRLSLQRIHFVHLDCAATFTSGRTSMSAHRQTNSSETARRGGGVLICTFSFVVNGEKKPLESENLTKGFRRIKDVGFSPKSVGARSNSWDLVPSWQSSLTRTHDLKN
jgi:hypothetical protein